MNREPLATIAAIVVVIQLLAPGAVIFGLVDWSVDQLAFVESFVIAVSAIPATLFVRTKVTPTSSPNLPPPEPEPGFEPPN
ncbi:hypothetical protein LCGC14_2150170 [marine sediment metagenome]|uniref:Uncharacterized protein n=1 Tax=marine sediment metagenome TaxID=412755 RepID=A0A0F9G8S8_9ZZZZ